MARQTSRQRLTAYLRAHPGQSVAQIARALGMQSANIRRHLGILSADGRVTSEAARRDGRRGRPQRTFRLSDAVLGNNLAGLVHALLGRSPSLRTGLIQEIADALWTQAGLIGQPQRGVRALTDALERLNRLHYAARWEAGGGGPRIILGRCPYAAVLEQHPELCQVDAALLARLAGGEVEQASRIGLQGATTCIFAPTTGRLRDPRADAA